MMDIGPLQNIPLHIISEILSHLDSIQDLASAALSHRVFYFAFQDNRDQTVKRIITNQISADLLPYAFALSECGNVGTGEADVARRLLARLHGSVQNPAGASSSLSEIPLKQLRSISQDHEVIESLVQDLASEMIPLLNHKLGTNHPDRISWRERFRIGRAFYRYLIMCSLFSRRDDFRIDDDERDKLLFKPFSPWVNEQLVCVYAYLQRKVCTAFDDVAAHDVEYGEMPVSWDDDPEDLPHLQDFLSQNVHFLHTVLDATSFDERIKLMPLSKFTARSFDRHPTSLLDSLAIDTFLRDLVWQTGVDIDGLHGTLSLNRERIESLSYPSNGTHDGTDSGSFNMWFSSHLDAEIFDDEILEATYCQEDKNLWEFGYVFWDCEEFDEARMALRFDQTRRALPFFIREYNWNADAIYESQNQRTDIYMKGGSGYWAPGKFDFSRIHGLRDGDEEELLHRWELQREKRALTYD